jgi:predicted RNase H-like nuclease (RuvC/YqgF family)
LEGLLDDREESSGHAQNIIEESSKRADVDRALLEELRSRNSELETKLQAASWRNGYLESKLEERDIQIKLLTDSQQKPSWWQRFKAFFVK